MVGMNDMNELLALQRKAFAADPDPSARVRIDRLNRAIDLLLAHQHEICEAAQADYGRRPALVTRTADIFPAVLALKYARSHLKSWMRPKRRRIGLPMSVPGMRATIQYQPLGVIGVISPWNFPVNLSFGPLAGVLAAGNRCLLKPSEITPTVSAVMQKLVQGAFDPAEFSVITGDAQVAAAFSRLVFDHLLFTGSSTVGKRVMAAAAENLVPVTLELGGKCPVILGGSANLAAAVDRILIGKHINSGQMCIAPDFVYLPRASVDAFVSEAKRWAQSAFTHWPNAGDSTNLVDDRQAQRVGDMILEALKAGARIVELTSAQESNGTRLVAPKLVIGGNDSIRVMREEIFAPLLPLRPYDRIEEVIAELRASPRPLALYYFGDDSTEQRRLLSHTHSGGVTINDVASHFLIEALPFGGIGASGMGAYHGEHGFYRFSHARAVLKQSRLNVNGLLGLRPPYGPRLERSLKLLLRR
jgi:coniferyl-aldehyde dehydrogenase